jgi:hypothetical protein
MAATTADQIVDRVRSICVAAPFNLVEAAAWPSFDLDPTQSLEAGVFRIPPPSSQGVLGMTDFAEDRTDTLQIWVARKHNQDYDGVRRSLLREAHSLTAAIVRDAAQVSGEYGILDTGRGRVIANDPGKEYVALKLSLPINYESQL